MKTIFCSNPLTYEEILNWRGFAFEESLMLKQFPITSPAALLASLDDSDYGIRESERIMKNVINKRRGF